MVKKEITYRALCLFLMVMLSFITKAQISQGGLHYSTIWKNRLNTNTLQL